MVVDAKDHGQRHGPYGNIGKIRRSYFLEDDRRKQNVIANVINGGPMLLRNQPAAAQAVAHEDHDKHREQGDEGLGHACLRASSAA